MSQPELEHRVAKYVVAGIAIIALVVVAYIDLAAEENVSPFVYGALAGAILGVDAIKDWFRK